MTQFNTLFEIRFFQRFYETHTLRDLEVIPSPQTIQQLKSFQLIYRKTPESLVILYNEDKKFLLESQRTPIFLSFGLKALNRHFETFTLLNPINKKTRYFLDNRNVGKDGQLHAGDWIDHTSLGAWFAEGEDPRLLLQDTECSILNEGNLFFDGKAGDKFGWSVDDPAGWFEFTNLTAGGARRLYRLSDAFRLSWAVIDLFVGGSGAFSFNQVSGKKYLVSLDHREVYWHYYFISENESMSVDIEIYRGKDRLSFMPLEKVNLVNGQRALRLISKETFPLKNRPQDIIITALIINKESEHSLAPVRILPLPTADASRIKGKVTPEGEIYFWEAYVYI